MNFLRNISWEGVLRGVLPGMRMRLALTTFLLVSVVMGAATMASLRQQEQALQEAYERELEGPLAFVNAATVDMDNSARALVLVEDFRTRLNRKTRELSKLKKTVYRKQNSFLNSLRRLGSVFGAAVRYDYAARRQDTYFSEYLSADYVLDFETKVRTRFRSAQGGPIDENSWLRLKRLAAAVAASEGELEAAGRRVTEIGEREVELTQALGGEAGKEAGAQTPKAQADRKELKALSTERTGLNKRIETLSNKQMRGTLQLKHAIQEFFRNSYRHKLEDSIGTSAEIRILSLNTKGDIVFDTGRILTRSAVMTRRLFRSEEFQRDWKTFFQKQFETETPEQTRRYTLDGSRFDAIFRPSFQNQDTQRRAQALLQHSRDPVYRSLLEQDEKACAAIAEQGARIRGRLRELRTKGMKPSADAQFRALYRRYALLLRERRKLAEKGDPVLALDKKRRARMKADIAALRVENRNSEQVLKVKSRLLSGPPPKDGKPLDPAQVELQMERLRAAIDDRESNILLLEGLMDDWREPTEYLASDAILHLRDAALFSHAYLPYGQEGPSLDYYLRSGPARESQQRRWEGLRAWVMAGESENEIGTFVTSAGRAMKILEGGTLARSRSEIEELMIEVDSTPLFTTDPERSLANAYSTRSFSGYHLIIIDKTEGIKRIRENGKQVLAIAAAISAFAAVLAFFFSAFAVRRIKSLMIAAQRVGRGELAVVFAENGFDEVADLGKTMNEMVRGLREREEMRGELAAAEEIQKRLLPEHNPANIRNRCELSGFYKAMSGVGGDYYDMIETGPDEIFLCVGDVSSHGVGPALVMTLVRADLRAILRRGQRALPDILLELNEKLYADTPDHIFVTFLLAKFDLRTGQMEHISAGHCQPIQWDEAAGGVRVLKSGGMPLGMDENALFGTTIQARRTTIRPGDVFVLYTDGLTEAMTEAREQFGLDKLARRVGVHHRLSAPEIATALAGDVQSFSGKAILEPGQSDLNDDIAILVLKRSA